LRFAADVGASVTKTICQFVYTPRFRDGDDSLTDIAQTRAQAFWDQLEDRFQEFVHRTRTDSFYGLEMLICRDRMTRIALAAHRGKPAPEGYLSPITATQFLEAHGIAYEIAEGALDNIPAFGPVLIVGNHPHGIVEAVIAAAAIEQVRKDLLALANYSLLSNPICGPYIAPIDFRQGPNAERFNLRSVTRFRNHIKAGGAGFIAPSGAVATRLELAKTATDAEWQSSAAKWARIHNATVVPVYIEGDNSALFHLASRLNPVFRLGVMALENYRLRNSRRRGAIGAPISPDELKAFATPIEATRFLRERTLALRDKLAPSA
jgi:putative hemolysin